MLYNIVVAVFVVVVVVVDNYFLINCAHSIGNDESHLFFGGVFSRALLSILESVTQGQIVYICVPNMTAVVYMFICHTICLLFENETYCLSSLLFSIEREQTQNQNKNTT